MSVAHALPFTRLGLIDDPTPRGGALNMAIDETLLGGLDGEPLLRVYRWARPTVSMGYFDAAEPVLGQWPGHEVVRRWTGGGIVEHGHDLTFSLLVPRTLPLAALPAAESYRLIHLAVAAAMERIGGPASTLGIVPKESVGVPSRACFEHPVTHDLMIASRKAAGGAQRRTRRGLLHQGSIQTGNVVQPAWFAPLADALPGAFGLAIDRRSLSAVQLAAAASLAAAKYGTPTWLRRF